MGGAWGRLALLVSVYDESPPSVCIHFLHKISPVHLCLIPFLVKKECIVIIKNKRLQYHVFKGANHYVLVPLILSKLTCPPFLSFF